MGLTVKGQAISATQSDIAGTLLGVGKQFGAPPVANVAIIYAAMGETSLGTVFDTYQNNGYGYWGVLQGSTSAWPDPHNVVGMATAFYKGGAGFQAGGAITLAGQGVTNPAEIAIRVEVPSIWPDDAYARQWPGGQAQGLQEAQAIVQAFGGGSLTISGGTAGAGGTGTSGNILPASPWTVGDPTNPDQDYWTTINRYGQAAQMYIFSDGEQLYVADGYRLMAQRPVAVISRLDPAVLQARAVWDNTAFQYTSTHHRRGRIQRRTSLAKVTSPTQVTMQLVCDIDQFRAGDVVMLAADFRPADGPWLIGDCRRDIFSPYTELTLVQTMTPINAADGTTSPSTAVQATMGPSQNIKWGSTTVSGHPELKPHISQIVNTILAQFPRLVITSTVRPEAGSYHATGEACDIASGDQALMDRAAAWVATNLTAQLSEGIHQDGDGTVGLSVKYGAPVPASFWGASTWAQHINHIHVARAEAGVNSPP